MLAIQAAAFLRGDANQDGRVEISDPVQILAYLFLGVAAPPCLDAADADDSGRLDITDPIVILGFLFRGSSEPAAPGPFDAGPDPTPDPLSCLKSS